MDITCLFLGFLFFISGYLIFSQKITNYLIKRNSFKQKENIKVNLLYKNIGFMIIVNSLIFLLSGFSSRFKKNIFTWSIILWFILTVFDIYWIEKLKKCKIRD